MTQSITIKNKNLNPLFIYFTPKLFAILILGIASGLPLALTGSTLTVWLTEVGVNIKTIGLFAAVGIPYSMKFLWSPLIDYFPVPILSKLFGRRSGWIILTQILLAIVVLFLGASDPVENVGYAAVLAVIVAFLSATQDIVIDAYRVEMIETNQQGAASAMAISGYRIGMLVSGAGALIISEYYSWFVVYGICAFILLIGSLTVILLGEPKKEGADSLSVYERNNLSNKSQGIVEIIEGSVIAPIKSLMENPNWLIMLLFVIFYKFGDAMASSLTSTFLLDGVGFSKSEIAAIVKTLGFFATLLGTFIGGMMVYKLGMMKSLFICGILQMLSNLMFAVQAVIGYDLQVLSATIFIENITGGMGSAALVAYLTSLCNIAYTATHYALLSSLATLGRTLLSTPAGYIVSYTGWIPFFVLSTLAAIPGLILLVVLRKKLANVKAYQG
jgi:PAT family beta-lactamase induction signal transducer AmpG